jgi:ADP-heptose:LPS heptosyltransferase
MPQSLLDRIRLNRDLLRRRLAMWRWDRPRLPAPDYVDRVVFVRWDAKLGDAIVLSWVLRELRRQRPDLEIAVITSPAMAPLFRQGFGIESVFLASKSHGWSGLPAIAQALRHSRYVVHMSEIWRPRDLKFVHDLAPEYVVGLDDSLQTVNVKLGEATRGHHFSEKLVPWLAQLGIDTQHRRYHIPRSAAAQARVAEAWPAGRVVGLCPYGASKSRQLSMGQIRFVIQQIVLHPDVSVWISVKPDQAAALQQALGQELWFDRLFFGLTDDVMVLCEQVACCDAVVSVDTAIVHIASGLEKPLLALYALHHNQFDMWRAMSDVAMCQFVVMGPPCFSHQESVDLKSEIRTLLDRVQSIV